MTASAPRTHADEAKRLEAAVAKVTKERKVGTYDVAMKNTSLEVAEEVARHV